MTPGQRAETRTPWRLASMRSALERPTTACFVAVYDACAGVGTRPATDAVLMMWPARRRIMTG